MLHVDSSKASPRPQHFHYGTAPPSYGMSSSSDSDSKLPPPHTISLAKSPTPHMIFCETRPAQISLAKRYGRLDVLQTG